MPGRDSERILDSLRRAIDWQPDLLLIEPGFGAFLRERPLSEARKWLLRLQRQSALLWLVAAGCRHRRWWCRVG